MVPFCTQFHFSTLVVFFLKFCRGLAETAFKAYTEIFWIHKASHKGDFSYGVFRLLHKLDGTFQPDIHNELLD